MKSDISVVIPTHNRPQDIKRTLASVFNQTQQPVEVIVVDDGSAPPVTRDIFADAPAGLFTVLLRNESPKGAPHARNLGIKAAKGEWIAFLDDDDEFVPGKIQLINQIIADNPQTDFIYHPAVIHLVNEKIKYVSKPGNLNDNSDNVKKLLLKNEIGGTSMTIIQKRILFDAGLFKEGLPALQDVELWLRCAKVGASFLFAEEPLTNYFYNTSKKGITFNNKARVEAMDFIRHRFSSDYAMLSKVERGLLKERELRSVVFKALLNKQRLIAFTEQWKVFTHTKKVKDLILLLSIPFGTWFVFKIRSSVQ